MMESTKHESAGDSNLWEDCPSGELQGLSRRLRTAERRRQQSALIRTVGATTAASAALVLAIGMMFGGDGHHSISCAECQATFAAYHDHLANGVAMQEVSADQMGEHLMKCNWCKDMYEDKYPGELIDTGVITRTTSIQVKPLGGLGYAAAF